MLALLGRALDLILVHFCRQDCEVNLYHGAGGLLFVLVLLQHVFVLDFQSEGGCLWLVKVLSVVNSNSLVVTEGFLEMGSLVNDRVLIVDDRVAYFDR